MARLAAVPEGAGALFNAALAKIGELSQLVSALPQTADASSEPLGDTLQGTTRPWNTRIVPQPCFRSRRAKRPRVAPSAVHADSAAASELVSNLSRGDSGRERVPQVHHDHTY